MSAGGTYQLPDGPYGIKEEYNQGVKDEYHSSPVGPGESMIVGQN